MVLHRNKILRALSSYRSNFRGGSSNIFLYNLYVVSSVIRGRRTATAQCLTVNATIVGSIPIGEINYVHFLALMKKQAVVLTSAT